MTGNSCILDTSIVIDLFRGNGIIASRLDSVENICVPSTVAGELFYGAYKSANLTKHLMQIRFFLNNSKLLITDNITAEVYGKIKVALMQKGKPIPENDIHRGTINATRASIVQYRQSLCRNRRP